MVFIRLLRFLLGGRSAVAVVVVGAGVGVPAGVTVRVRCISASVRVILFRHPQDLSCFVILVGAVLPISFFDVICVDLIDQLFGLITAD